MNLLLLSLALLGCLAITVSSTERYPPPTGIECGFSGCHPKSGNGKRESAAEEAFAHSNSCTCNAFGECYEWKDGKFSKVPFCPNFKREQIVNKRGAVDKREFAAEEAPRKNCYCTGFNKCYEVQDDGSYKKVQACTAKREATEEIIEKSGAVEKRESAEESAGGVDTNVQCPRCSNTSGKREASEDTVEKSEVVEKREAEEAEAFAHANSCTCSAFGDCYEWKDGKFQKVPFCPKFKREQIVNKRGTVEKRESAVEEAPRKNCYCTGFNKCYEVQEDGSYKKVQACTAKREATEEIIEKSEVVEKRESAEESAGGVDTNVQCPRCSNSSGKRETSVETVEKSEVVEKRESTEEIVEKREAAEEKNGCYYLICDRPKAKTNRGCRRVLCDFMEGYEKREAGAVEKRESEEGDGLGSKGLCRCVNGKCSLCTIIIAGNPKGCSEVPSCPPPKRDTNGIQKRNTEEEAKTTFRKREAPVGFESCMCNNGECERCDKEGCQTVSRCTGKRDASEEIVEKREAVESEEE